MTKPKLLLLDGNSLAYRAFFALPLLTNSQGVHTNAAYGFTMMLQNILEEHHPEQILVAWDKGKVTFRHETFKEYKGGRQKTPNELREQFPIIRDILTAHGIAQYELEAYEADDIIGTLANRYNDSHEVIIISGDKDLTQLVTDKTTVFITRKGITDMEKYTPEHVMEKYGITPPQIIDMKGLMGDSSDNIPGVPGVGEKTALKLLKQYETVEGVYEHLDDITAKKLNENLTTYRDQAFMSKQLATIEVNAPIDVPADMMNYAGPDLEKLREQYEMLESKRLLDQLKGDAPSEMQVEISYVTFDREEGIVWPEKASLHIELDGDNYLTDPVLVMTIAMAGKEGSEGVYTFDERQIAEYESLKVWLEDETIIKYASDTKAIQSVLHRYGIALRGVQYDLLLASYIADASNAQKELAQLAEELTLPYEVRRDEDVYGKGAKRQVPEFDVYTYHAATKAKAVWDSVPIVEEQLKESEQYELFHDLELPLASILSEMETEGIAVDETVLQTLGKDLSERLAMLESDIYTLAGETFNINSPKQLGVILFEKIGLTPIKKTKTGYSTAADVLEKLEHEHEIIALILLYRQLGKLNSTYVEGLQKEIHTDGKIHTRFQQALTTTGRLSSINPNLQNIPIRLEEGRKIREAFVPSHEGWKLFAADYSQIELRVLAHISEDEKLIDAFQRGADIHTETAMNVFHVSREEVDSNMRRAAKAVNFGIIYGISDYGLSQNLNISRPEAKKFIDTYLHTFEGVKRYMDKSIEIAKKRGYAETLMNRRRYLPDLNSSSFNIRSFAERTAMNTPIQGSAADIIKRAMIDMNARLKEEGLQAKMLLQVHDELIFEAPEEEIEILEKIVPEVMEQTIQLRVPLKVDSASGASWYEV